MAQTVSSGAATYCSAARFLQRYDARTIGDLVSDDGTRVSSASLLTNTNLAALLKEASGKLEAACVVGERYSPTDLAAIITDGGNMAEFMAGLVADIAISLVYRRRPDVTMPVMPQVDESMRLLNALSEGKMILGFTEAMTSGHMSSEIETSAIVEARKMATTYAESLFGRRNNRIDSPVTSDDDL